MMGLPPWLDVRPSDFVKAANEGAQAGIESARTVQQGREASDRAALSSQELALQAQSESHRAQQAAAQLAQQERMGAMEAQMRQQTMQQNFLREQQKDNILNAYHQAQIGLGKDRIDMAQKAAQQKAATAAQQWMEESQFAKDVGDGMSIPDALQRHPTVRPAVMNTLQRATAADKDYGDVETQNLPGGATAIFRRGSPGVHVVTPKKSASVDEWLLRQEFGVLMRGIVSGQTSTKDLPAANKRLDEIKNQLRSLGGGQSSTGTSQGGTPFKEGQRIRDKKSGKIFVVRNGQPVPEAEDKQPAQELDTRAQPGTDEGVDQGDETDDNE